MTLKTWKHTERFAKILTVVSFVLMCWVAQRILQPRTNCVESSFLSFVQFGHDRFENCLFENRLSFSSGSSPTQEQSKIIKAMEVLEPLRPLLPSKTPQVAVDIHADNAEIFELGRGFVRIGKKWTEDPVQLRRALIMGLLRFHYPRKYAGQFQLEVISDFIVLSILNQDAWLDERREQHSLRKEQRFSTAAASFERYCQSPFRSLSHVGVCAVDDPARIELQENVWGLRPLLALTLVGIFEKLPLRQQSRFLNALKEDSSLPEVRLLKNASAEEMTAWVRGSVSDYLHSLLGQVPTIEGQDPLSLAYRQTLHQLEVESPTHWELTVDLTNTPAWREIFEQMRQRSLIVKERVLVFTPEGSRALPSGLPVAWAADEVSSQKHVLIACHWPRPDEVVHIQARHMFAQQTCGKLQDAFWD